jgi:hypothetical protein
MLLLLLLLLWPHLCHSNSNATWCQPKQASQQLLL